MQRLQAKVGNLQLELLASDGRFTIVHAHWQEERLSSLGTTWWLSRDWRISSWGWTCLLLLGPGHLARFIPRLLLRYLPRVFPEIGSLLLAVLLHDVIYAFFLAIYLGLLHFLSFVPVFEMINVQTFDFGQYLWMYGYMDCIYGLCLWTYGYWVLFLHEAQFSKCWDLFLHEAQINDFTNFSNFPEKWKFFAPVWNQREFPNLCARNSWRGPKRPSRCQTGFLPQFFSFLKNLPQCVVNLVIGDFLTFPILGLVLDFRASS